MCRIGYFYRTSPETKHNSWQPEQLYYKEQESLRRREVGRVKNKNKTLTQETTARVARETKVNVDFLYPHFVTHLPYFTKTNHNSLSYATCCGSKHKNYVNIIQFIIFRGAQYHKLENYLRGLYNLYTYDIPDLWPHIGSGKTPKK